LTKLYAAYGSNLNHEQMDTRCPQSKFMGSSVLKGWQLLFKAAATIRIGEKFEVPVGLFEITEECEKSLDIYEDYPKLYNKRFVEVELNESKIKAMTYIMEADYGIGPPSKRYYNVIYKGYVDCKLDLKYLKYAKEYSEKNDSGKSYRSVRWHGEDR